MSETPPLELEDLARRMRGSLASLRAAAEALERFPGMEAEQRRRLHAVVGEESARLAELVGGLESLARGGERSDRRPIATAELTLRMRDALAEPGLEVESTEHDSAESGAELLLDTDTLTAAFRGFAAALRKDFAVVRCRLRAEEIDRHLLLDGSWQPDPSDATRLQDWQGQALEAGSDAPALRPTARQHGGEAWFDLDRVPSPEGRRAHVRVLLPLAGDAREP